MINFNKQKNKGFTLIETMIAVFILATAITGIMGLIATNLYAAKYSKNEITANYLIQEAVDYIRNDRDSIAFQAYNGGTWDSFISQYGACFSTSGCEIEPAVNTIKPCLNPSPNYCDTLNYDDSAVNNDFYTYSTPSNYKVSSFNRIIKMSHPLTSDLILNADEVDITVTVNWLNGSLAQSKSLSTSLLNWQK